MHSSRAASSGSKRSSHATSGSNPTRSRRSVLIFGLLAAAALLVLIGAFMLGGGHGIANNDGRNQGDFERSEAGGSKRVVGARENVSGSDDQKYDGIQSSSSQSSQSSVLEATDAPSLPPPSPLTSPTFSIVMLSYKSPKSLQQTLHSLFHSRLAYHPWLAEVVVYFQARRVGEKAKRRVGDDEVEEDPDEALVREVYESHQGDDWRVKGGEDSRSHSSALPSPAPFKILGDGTNLPVALATAKAVEAAKGDLVLYLECDRPLLSDVVMRAFGRSKGSHNGGKDLDEASDRLSAFAYSQIAVAIDHLYFLKLNASHSRKASPSSSSSSSSLYRTPFAADVFRFQLYSGDHIDFESKADAKASSRKSVVVPTTTYGNTPHQYCMATPWFHPSTSSLYNPQSAHQHQQQRVHQHQHQEDARDGELSFDTPPANLKDACANYKHAKKRYGHVFATAYCKHWKKINNMEGSKGGGGGGVSLPMFDASSLSEMAANPFFLAAQADMCDSTCFLDWSLSSITASGLQVGGGPSSSSFALSSPPTSFSSPYYPSLWKAASSPSPLPMVAKLLARGVQINANYSYTEALVRAAATTPPNRRTRRPTRDGDSLNAKVDVLPRHIITTQPDKVSSHLPVVCLTSEDCNWTNQPTMYLRQWYLDNIAHSCKRSHDYCIGAAGRQSAVRQELFFKIKKAAWADQRYRICLSKGMFVHDEVDNRE